MDLVCKRCGNQEQCNQYSDCKEFTFTNEHDDLSPTICACNKCGNNGVVNIFVKSASASVGGKTQDASDAPSQPIYAPNTRNVERRFRKKPEKRIMHIDEEDQTKGAGHSNPFVKKAGVAINDKEAISRNGIDVSDANFVMYDPSDPKRIMKYMKNTDTIFSHDGGQSWRYTGGISVQELVERQGFKPIFKEKGYYVDYIDDKYEREEGDLMGFDNDNDWDSMKGSIASSNPFVKKSGNPFVKSQTDKEIKVAREFKRSPWGEYMKGVSEENMAFPENPPTSKKPTKKKEDKKKEDSKPRGGVERDSPHGSNSGNSGSSDENKFPTYDFNSVDRKEYRSSPKRRDLEPGAAAWEDKEIDKQYDGWVSDHIRNSGGEVVGSNTPKNNIMNLNDGEREKDLGNRDSVYERLLESRHNFNDDYKFIEVAGEKVGISKEASKVIESMKIDDDNTFISKSALEIMVKKNASSEKEGECKDCDKQNSDLFAGKKKRSDKLASKFPLLSIPI